MELIVILIGAAVVLAGAFALAAVSAAGENERARGSGRFERAATWQAGYSTADLHLLAGMAAVARVELAAEEIEVVLKHVDGSGDGVVITGSRLPPGRLASRVARGDGLAGRTLLAGRPMFGSGEPAALGVPIVSAGVVVGAITAVAEADGSFGTWHVLRLAALAAEAGRHLGPRAVMSGAQRDAG